MSRPAQLPLSLPPFPALGLRTFVVSESNCAAFEAVAGADGPVRRLALSGPAGSGKTHLAAIWAEATGAERLEATDLAPDTITALPGLPAVVIERGDRIADLDPARRAAAEEAFFHLLNLTAAEGIALLVTGRRPPARWDIATPDVRSRLAALVHVPIGPPDDVLLSSILAKLFADRQMTVGSDVIEYLLVRMERSFAAAEKVADRLDRMALAGRRRITKRLAIDLHGSGDDALRGDGDEM